MTGILYPVAIKDVDKVESMNNISIHVFGLEDDHINCYISQTVMLIITF